MELPDLVLLTIAIMNVALGALVLFGNRKNPINIWFASFAWSLALWATTLIAFRIVLSNVLAAIFLKFTYISAICIAASLTIFMHYFPETQPFRRFWRTFFIVSTALLGIFIFLPGVLITRVETIDGVRVGIQQLVGYYIFSAYFVSYFFGALYFLFKQWQRAAGETRTNIGYIIWSILTAGMFGVIFNLILPSPWFHDWRFTWLGPVFTAIIVSAVAYAIAKHRLLNVKILAAELLTMTIAFVLFIQSIFAGSVREFFVRFSFFVLAAFFGWFLVKSVRREVEQKEELARLTVELERANKELKKLDQLKSDFLSFASHQLRGPLAAIKGYISMVVEGTYGAVPGPVRETLDRVYQSNEKLIHLVDDFLNLARIEEGRIQYSFAPASVEGLVDDAVQALAQNAEKKGLELRWERPSPPLASIVMDAGKILEVVYNLIDNAIKYTEHGKVEVSAERIRTGVRISVRDTGVGIAPDDLAVLFTRFGRAGGKRNSTNGVGIGLYIAKFIVEAHGGRIWVESPGSFKGSAFFIELPFMPPKLNEK